ncbi:lipase family protein [Streptomyces sp. 549]|uniref:lipase family protein n=1 Tax=Streptomyces sp. 549 TaxID=3049076 RepID=UPI0024C2ED96|nr:lipase family protein [Streptomyces sp. 549]MDK1473483.1 lipase family protein [Streptomyces sp. 549]
MTRAPALLHPPENAPAGDAFYTPPAPLPGGACGDPIHQRRLDNPAAALTDGVNWLVLYRSQDLHGRPLATSGIVALPRMSPPPGGFPVVSWAHGTVGVADLCAPSRNDLRSRAHAANASPHTLLNAFLRQGWAVVMSDYEHLGTTGGRHPYMLGASHAAAVLDIVRTARHLFPEQVSHRFALVGHAQGGQGVLFAAHHAPAWPDLDLRAVAAVAPANHLLDQVRATARLPARGAGGPALTPLLLSGAMGGDPAIRPHRVLSAAAYALWPHVDRRCPAGLGEPDSWGRLRGTDQFKGDYPAQPTEDQQRFEAQLDAMNPNVTVSVPARISQAADDLLVRADPPAPQRGTDTLVEELRLTNKDSGHSVEYRRYAAGEVPQDEPLGVHFSTLTHDTPHLLGWLGPHLAAR